MEKFNPYDPKYERVEDLPKKHQAAYVDLEGGGFVKSTVLSEEKKHKEAANEQNKKRPRLQKLLGVNKLTPMDIAHE